MVLYVCTQDPHSLLGENRLGLYLGPDIDFGIKRIKPASSQLSAKSVARLYADLAGHQLHDSSAPEASLLLNLLCSKPLLSVCSGQHAPSCSLDFFGYKCARCLCRTPEGSMNAELTSTVDAQQILDGLICLSALSAHAFHIGQSVLPANVKCMSVQARCAHAFLCSCCQGRLGGGCMSCEATSLSEWKVA